jgi:uncharacterized lipoprotein NlpE involved in copper resistance
MKFLTFAILILLLIGCNNKADHGLDGFWISDSNIINEIGTGKFSLELSAENFAYQQDVNSSDKIILKGNYVYKDSMLILNSSKQLAKQGDQVIHEEADILVLKFKVVRISSDKIRLTDISNNISTTVSRKN